MTVARVTGGSMARSNGTTGLAARLGAVASAAFIVLGLVVPVVVRADGADSRTPLELTARALDALALLGAGAGRGPAGETGTEAVRTAVVGGVAAAVFLVALVALAALVVVWRRRDERPPGFVDTAFVLLVLAVVLGWATLLFGTATDPDWTAGWSLPLVTAGAAIGIAVVFAPTASEPRDD